MERAPSLVCSLLVVLVSSGLWSYFRHLFLSGGFESGRELRYYPFRLMPYLTKVRNLDSSEGWPCCLLIAERIHSGYEGNLGKALGEPGMGTGRGAELLFCSGLCLGDGCSSVLEHVLDL